MMGAFLFGEVPNTPQQRGGRREGRMVLEERGVVDAWKLFTEPARLPERRSVLARGTRS